MISMINGAFEIQKLNIRSKINWDTDAMCVRVCVCVDNVQNQEDMRSVLG